MTSWVEAFTLRMFLGTGLSRLSQCSVWTLKFMFHQQFYVCVIFVFFCDFCIMVSELIVDIWVAQ